MSSLCKSTDFLSVHSSSSSVAAGALASSRDWFTMTSGLVVGTCWAGRVAVDIGRVIDKPLWAAGWAVAGAWGAGVMAVGWVTYKPFSTASCKSLPPPPLDYDYDGNEEEGKKMMIIMIMVTTTAMPIVVMVVVLLLWLWLGGVGIYWLLGE